MKGFGSVRAKFQVLVFPYYVINDQIKFVVLKREDLCVWQGIAGGEDDELPLQAAKREASEELNISLLSEYISLDSTASIPANNFKNHVQLWGEDTFVIPEYSFGVLVTNDVLKLSEEHTEYRWCSYDEAINLLEWDSNKRALWELNERLKRKHKLNNVSL